MSKEEIIYVGYALMWSPFFVFLCWAPIFYFILPFVRAFRKKMKIEFLINDTYQVITRERYGGTVWYKGTLSECQSYIKQNKDDE